MRDDRLVTMRSEPRAGPPRAVGVLDERIAVSAAWPEAFAEPGVPERAVEPRPIGESTLAGVIGRVSPQKDAVGRVFVPPL